MGMNAGKLRHRLFLQKPASTQDTNTGEITDTWQHVAGVSAAIEPLSARDFIAAGGTRSSVSVRLVIRWTSKPLTTDMRFVSPKGQIYEPIAFLADPDTGREYLTIPCRVRS